LHREQKFLRSRFDQRIAHRSLHRALPASRIDQHAARGLVNTASMRFDRSAFPQPRDSAQRSMTNPSQQCAEAEK